MEGDEEERLHYGGRQRAHCRHGEHEGDEVKR
jgi:hypothetical protein